MDDFDSELGVFPNQCNFGMNDTAVSNLENVANIVKVTEPFFEC